uniref:Anion exchange protein n=1 Tax=Gouania willdenowi TaxID=441366 RepID=A0A8C5FZN9_GOUWI
VAAHLDIEMSLCLMSIPELSPLSPSILSFTESSSCPLDKLMMDSHQELQWREAAHWIIGEEQEQEKCPVPSLCSHSLLELQNIISHGEARAVGRMRKCVRDLKRRDVIRCQISVEDQKLVLRALMLQHRYHPTPSILFSLMTLTNTCKESSDSPVVCAGSMDFLEKPFLAFVRLQEAIVLDSFLEVSVPVRFLLVLLGPPTANVDYHQFANVSSFRNFMGQYASLIRPPSDVNADRLLQVRIFLQRGHAQQVGGRSRALINPKPCDENPATHWVLFGGLIKDVTRRYPQYLSDIKDALNFQCLAATIFIYFAALSPAITFGGLLGEKTDGLIGVSELIVATALQGIVFSLLGAQPLLVIGFSGPLLVFEEAFYMFCKVNGIDYLTGRLWIGFWLVLIVLLTVALEGSILVRFVSRFTQEIFSFLISLIFIYETFAKLVKVYSKRFFFKSNIETCVDALCNSSSVAFL